MSKLIQIWRDQVDTIYEQVSPARWRTLWWGVILLTLGVVIATNVEFLFVLALLVVLVVRAAVPGRSRLVSQRLWVTASIMAALEYLQIRFVVVNWEAVWIAIPLLVAELFGLVHMVGFQIIQWPKPERVARMPTRLPPNPVYVLVPTTDEGQAILEATVCGIRAARDRLVQYNPQASIEIVICNDGYVTNYPGWQGAERLAARLDVRCITRQVPGGAKAGNLEYVRARLQMPDDALMVVFDADHIPREDFFVKTLPFFTDPQMGWVQTGQYYRNTESVIANWANQQMLLFYDNICPHKAAHDALFLCGTNFVVRVRALAEVGGFPLDTPTEDFAVSIPMQLNGWRNVYLTERLSSGLGPMDMAAYLKQQSRWARGCLMAMGAYWRYIFLPWQRGLSLTQRFHYFLSGTHYLGGLRDLIFVLSPVTFLLIGISPIRSGSLTFIVIFSLYWFVSLTAATWHTMRYTALWRVNMMTFGSFPVMLRSLQRVLVQEFQPFDVTAKRRATMRDYTPLASHVGFVLLLVGALVVGWRYHSAPLRDVGVNLFWVVYSLVNLLGFIGLGLLDDWRASRTGAAADTDFESRP